MPILWRYLLRSYLQVFFLCVSSFIAILLVTRFQEIAKFASLSAQKSAIFLFILYQIPYILPIAIPISCLIAAILLIQKMSASHEMTALRAAGLPMKAIYTPIIFASIFLGLANLHIASELMPTCRQQSRNLVYEMTAANPLFLLQKDSLVKLKHTFIDMEDFESGKHAKNVVFAIHNQSNDRINLMIADVLALKQGLLVGKNVTFLTSVDTKNQDAFDHVILENQKFMTMQDSALAHFIQSSSQQSGYEHLPFRGMLAKYYVEKNAPLPSKERLIAETSRRLSLAATPFTFSWIGLSFGLDIGRKRSKKGIFFSMLLAASFLITFIAAKSLKNSQMIAAILYLLPHPVLAWFSTKFLKNAVEGKN